MLLISAWLLPESLDYLLAKRPKQALERINVTVNRMGLTALKALPYYGQNNQKIQVILVNYFQGSRGSRHFVFFAFFLVMFGFYFVMSWTPKILISMGMSPEQGVSTGILISIGGIFGQPLLVYLLHA